MCHSDNAHSRTCQHQKRRLANAHEDPRRTVWHAMIVQDGKKIVQALWRNEKLIKVRLKSTQWSRSSNVCVYVRRSLWQLITPSFILARWCHFCFFARHIKTCLSGRKLLTSDLQQSWRQSLADKPSLNESHGCFGWKTKRAAQWFFAHYDSEKQKFGTLVRNQRHGSQ